MSLAKPTRGPDCLSDLVFDRRAAGEVAPAELAAIDAHVTVCERCAQRSASLAAAAAIFADMHLPLPAGPRRSPRARWLAPAAAAIALAAGLLLFVRFRPVSEPTERLKGRAHVTFHVRHGETIREGADGEPVMPGDAVQLSYASHDRAFLAVLSLDSAHVVSTYFPAGGDTAAPIEPAASRELPTSVVLDGTLGPETVYAVFCETPVPLTELRAVVARGESPERSGCSVDTIHLSKHAP